MTILDTKSKYGSIHALFHWIMALGIILLLIVGFVMTSATTKNPTIYMMHKSFGVSILILAILRVMWIFLNAKLGRSTQPDPKINKIILKLGKLGHFSMYVFMFLMPISGMMMSMFYGIPISIFGLLKIPAFTPNYQIGAFFREIHGITGFLLAITILIHSIMALIHHYILKDNTLKKMLPSKA